MNGLKFDISEEFAARRDRLDESEAKIRELYARRDRKVLEARQILQDETRIAETEYQKARFESTGNT